MKLDVSTIVFIASTIFTTETIAVFIQYRVNKSYSGPGWWLIGAVFQAAGFFLMLMLHFKTIYMLAIFANPLVFLGQIFLYIGIIKFLGKRWHKWFSVLLYAVYIITYYYFIFISNSIFGRSLVVSFSSALISTIIAFTLYFDKKRYYPLSSNFTASVFLAYGCFQTAITVLTLILPPFISYSEFINQPVRLIAFIIPIVGSMLWTFGFIIMVNQRLNVENLEEKEQLQTIFNMSPDSKLITLMNGRILVDANAEFFITTGYARDEVLNNSIPYTSIWDNIEEMECFLAELSENGQVNNKEAFFKRKDGSRFIGMISGRIININEQAHIISSVNDITERKRSEQEIRDILAEKEHQYDQLVKTQEDLINSNIELEKISGQDKLTGLLNRRTLTEMLDREILRLDRFGGESSIIMSDIDHFKKINDNYGHLAGDEVLVRLASLLQESIRKADYCFRWGGEEFLILLIGTGYEGAMQIADKIRHKVETCELLPSCEVTISSGVSSYHREWSREFWIEKADNALYQAKNLGRNRVDGRP